MKPKPVFFIIILFFFTFWAAACGPSPESQTATADALTAAAVTDTPVPTQTPSATPEPTATPTETPTPTATLVPFDLIVNVLDTDGLAIQGATVVLGEVDDAGLSDETGVFSWADLPVEEANLAAAAQGYLPVETAALLERGLNTVTITLERDPFGRLATEVCSPTEILLYLEDFQDGTAPEWQEIEFRAMGWDLGPDPVEDGNLLVSSGGMNSNYSGMNALIVENGVWRLRLKISGPRSLAINWRVAPEPYEIDAGEVQDSRYQVIVSTGQGAHLQRVQLPPLNIGAANSSFVLAQDTWYFIEISTFDGRTELWIDGILVYGYTDPQPLPPGFISIDIFPSDAEGATVYFDDFALCGLSAPFEPLPIEDPSSDG